MKVKRLRQTPHVRLEAEEVKELWLNDRLTATGYILLLLKALKKDGWHLSIDDPDGDPNLTPVQRFCAKWEIKERTFYYAKAKLIAEGEIYEKIVGKVEIWTKISDFDTAKFCSASASDCSHTAKFCSASASDCSTAVLEPITDKRSQDSPTLTQLLNQLSLSSPPSLQPERENFNFGQEIKEETDREQIPKEESKTFEEVPNQSTINSPQNNQTIKAEAIEQVPPPRDDDEFLNFVIKTEVLTLPHPPATESQQKRLARSLIYKDEDVGDLRSAFDKYQQQRALIEARMSALQEPSMEALPKAPPPQPKTLGNHLTRLQDIFAVSRQSNASVMKAMRESAIAQALKLGFVVTDSSIELAPGQHPEQEVPDASA